MKNYRRTRSPGAVDPNAISGAFNIGLVSCESQTGSGTDTISWSHTIADNNFRLLLVVVGSLFELTSVTYGATGLTQFGTYVEAPQAHVSLWYMVNPPVGTATITVTSTDGGDYLEAGAMDYQNVNQTTPLAAYAGDTGIASTETLTISGTARDIALGWIKYWSPSTAVVPDGSLTELFSITSDGSWRTEAAEKAGAASSVISWTVPTDYDAAFAAVMIKGK